MESFEISNPQELEKLNFYIHDEYFSISEVGFDKASDIVTIPFRRIFHDGEEKISSSGFFTNTYEKEVLWAEIVVFHVKDLQIVNNAITETCAFNTVIYQFPKIEFICCEPCRLLLTVDDLKLNYREIELRGKTFIKRGPFFIESSGPKVYD